MEYYSIAIKNLMSYRRSCGYIYIRKYLMQINISPCGLVCSQCDAYRATQLNDAEKLELVAADWRELNHCDDIKAELLPCDGCMTEGGRKCFYCENMCEIRRCAIQK